MAEEEKIEEEQNKQGNKGEDRPQRKKIPVNLIIIVILALTLLGGGFFVWKSGLLIGIFSEDSSSLESNNKKRDIGPIYALDTFIVNLVGGRGKNYLKAKIELELDDRETIEEIDKRLPQFRDAILTTLSSKANEDINTLEGKFQLRAEIMSILNQYLKSGRILNVYFTDFIVQ